MMLSEDSDKENYAAKILSTFVQRPRALCSRGPSQNIRPQAVDGHSGILVPKLNLMFIDRVLHGGRVKPKASEFTVAASNFLRHSFRSKNTSKNVACDYSVSSQTSLESDLSGTRDFNARSLEHMDDDELKRILRRQYKKVHALYCNIYCNVVQSQI
jgi:hypothetical protein